MVGLIRKFKEKNLLTSIKKKDSDAFIKAYSLYFDDIYRFIYFKIGSAEEARDLASAVFLKTWNYIQSKNLLEGKTLRALLYKITRNLVIDHYRSKSGKQTISIDDEENQIDIVDESQDLGEKMDLAIDLEIVKDKLLELKEEYREILILRFINDLDLDEIADVTGKSKGNVRVFLHRALKSLKDLVEKDREKKKL